ncbi:hypothetical protein DERP_007834 [Dermatophagoides pteronyssinus]|uniref:Uncharacterized protein n=1 Tax=Dermatophagoides pteronyssinus TaxID=6956 RepID=A0ABQ8ISR7_DERPT|nr:hypothetical protein DERP_007834 [Dermatophagoides pteronyssinus]
MIKKNCSSSIKLYLDQKIYVSLINTTISGWYLLQDFNDFFFSAVIYRWEFKLQFEKKFITKKLRKLKKNI